MEKLLLTAALLTSFASAQWIEQRHVDKVTDEVTKMSYVVGKSMINKEAHDSVISFNCDVDDQLFVAVMQGRPDSRRLPQEYSIKFRVVGNEDNTPVTRGFGYGIAMLWDKSEADLFSGSEIRASYTDYSDNSHYFEFQLPDLKESDAYKDCFK